MRIIQACLCLGPLLLAAAGATAATEEKSPGLQAEKPAEGVRFVKTERGYLVPYKQLIPGTDGASDDQ